MAIEIISNFAFSVEQVMQAAETAGVQQARHVVFEYEDGKICGFEEEIAQ